jgi:hypothetical protein
VVPGLSTLTALGRVELRQGCGPALAASVGVLLPPRGPAFTQTALGRPDPRACCGHRRLVVGPLCGADRGSGCPEVVQQPGPDLLGQLGIGSPPPPAVDDDPPTVGGPERGHSRIVRHDTTRQLTGWVSARVAPSSIDRVPVGTAASVTAASAAATACAASSAARVTTGPRHQVSQRLRRRTVDPAGITSESS